MAADPALIEPDELIVLRDRLGLTTRQAARITRTDERRFRRWISGREDPSPAAVLLLRIADDFPPLLQWLIDRS